MEKFSRNEVEMTKKDIELFVLVWIIVIASIAGMGLGIKGLNSFFGEEVAGYIIGGSSFLILTGLFAAFIVWKLKEN